MIITESFIATLLMIVVLLSLLIGGGPTSPVTTAIVEMPAILLMSLAIIKTVDTIQPRVAKVVFIFIGSVCLVPILQLLPLPITFWRSLAGRSQPYYILEMAGFGNIARPLSLDPNATEKSGLALVVPIAVFLSTLNVGTQHRFRLMAAVAVFAVVSTLLGAFQVAAGGGLNLGIYPQVHDGYPIGFFANRNHEADLLLVSLPLASFLICERRYAQVSKAFALSLILLFFSAAVIATQSRSGFILLPLAAGAALLVYSSDYNRKYRGIVVLAIAAITLVGAVGLGLTPVGHKVLHRFSDAGDDLRGVIWLGTSRAIQAFWPFGSGLGTFPPVYNMFEDLDYVSNLSVNHAHNDYLEVALEAGLYGLVLIVLYLVLLTHAIFNGNAKGKRAERLVAITIVLIIMAHSIMDYPLRTFGLSAIFGFANGILFAPTIATQHTRLRRRRHLPFKPDPDAKSEI